MAGDPHSGRQSWGGIGGRKGHYMQTVTPPQVAGAEEKFPRPGLPDCKRFASPGGAACLGTCVRIRPRLTGVHLSAGLRQMAQIFLTCVTAWPSAARQYVLEASRPASTSLTPELISPPKPRIQPAGPHVLPILRLKILLSFCSGFLATCVVSGATLGTVLKSKVGRSSPESA